MPRRRSPRTFTWCALTTVMLTTIWAVPAAHAQPSDEQEERIGRFSPDEVRVRANITLSELATKKTSPPHIYIHADDLTQSWRVTITQKERGELQELSSVSLPSWFGDSYYDYAVTILPTGTGKDVYAMLEAIPSTERGAPSTAFTMQLVWLVETPPRGNTRWKYIDKAYQSDLDGGDALILRENAESKLGELIRSRERITKRFCGFINTTDDAQLEYYNTGKRIFVTDIDVTTLLKGVSDSLRAFIPSRPFAKEDLYGYVNWVLATSDLRTPTDSTTILRPLELGDSDLSTVWSEGTPKEGRGEFVTATISAALPLKGFRIYPGHGANKTIWDTTPHPSKVLIGLSDGTRFIAEFPENSYEDMDGSGGMLVEFPSPQNTECLSVMLLEAHPAKKSIGRRSSFEDTRAYELARAQSKAVTIAELTPISVLEGLSPSARSREILTRFQREENQGRRENLIQLTRQDGTYIVESLRDLLSQKESPISVYDAAMVLRSLDSEDAISLLIDLLAQTPPEGKDWRALRRAAAVHGEELAEPLWQRLQTLDPAQTRRRIDLTRLLGRIAPAELLEELIPLLGRGEERERNERIRAIAHGETMIVPALLDFIDTHLDSPAGKDALKNLEVLARRHGDTTLNEETSVQLIALTSKAKTRRDTLRLIHVLEYTRPEGSESLLARELLLGSRDRHIRRAAASALKSYESEISGDALRQALVDPSPDVRITAIQSLMERPDRARIAPDIIRYVDYERWTEGIKPAIFYLATLDDPDIDDKLSGWILDSSVPKRAYLSAQAFERVRRAPKLATLTAHLFKPETPFNFRRQLVELLAWETSQEGEELLVEILTAKRFNELEPPRRIALLERHVVMALGTRRSLRALPLFLKLLTDERQDIKLRRVILRSLSFYNEESLIDELKGLKRDAPSELFDMYDDTISTISRRIDIEGAKRSIEELEEKERKRQKERDDTPL